MLKPYLGCVLLNFILVSGAFTQTVCPQSFESRPPTGQEVLACLDELRGLRQEIDTLKTDAANAVAQARASVDAIKAELHELKGTSASVSDVIPRGAVVAFDRDDLTPDTCPPGWSPFKEALARVIVGAGDPKKAPEKMAFDQFGKPLRGYVLREHGGEQVHQITRSELPNFAPEIIAAGLPTDWEVTRVVPCPDTGCRIAGGITNGIYAGAGPGAKVSIEPLGEGAQENNMPTFVALFYCKKNP